MLQCEALRPQQRGESACLADPLVSFVDSFMPSRRSFVLFVFFVAVFALQCLNRNAVQHQVDEGLWSCRIITLSQN